MVFPMSLYGPDLCPETRCKIELIHALERRWSIEDKKRMLDKVWQIAEILLVVGLSFLAMTFSLAASPNVPMDVINPYFYIGIGSLFLAIAIFTLLLVHAIDKGVDALEAHVMKRRQSP